jgi:hypothetical protein
MSERRPHWDDELIFAVMSAAGDGGHLFIDDIHAVIAAVEDWHKAKRDRRDRTHSDECWRWHQECAEHLIERQRSTIQRVRELHYNTATHHPSGCCSECGGTYPCPTVRALDGGAE